MLPMLNDACLWFQNTAMQVVSSLRLRARKCQRPAQAFMDPPDTFQAPFPFTDLLASEDLLSVRRRPECQIGPGGARRPEKMKQCSIQHDMLTEAASYSHPACDTLPRHPLQIRSLGLRRFLWSPSPYRCRRGLVAEDK